MRLIYPVSVRMSLELAQHLLPKPDKTLQYNSIAVVARSKDGLIWYHQWPLIPDPPEEL